MIRFGCILNVNLFEQTVLWVHGGVPKLLGVHLTKTFVSLCRDILLKSLAVLVNEALPLHFIIAVLLDLALCAQIERWCCNEQMSLLDELRHITEEQCHDKGVDV